MQLHSPDSEDLSLSGISTHYGNNSSRSRIRILKMSPFSLSRWIFLQCSFMTFWSKFRLMRRALVFCIGKRFENLVQSLRGIYHLFTRLFLRAPFPRTPHTKTHIRVLCDWWWRSFPSDNRNILCSNATYRCFAFYEILSWWSSFHNSTKDFWFALINRSRESAKKYRIIMLLFLNFFFA